MVKGILFVLLALCSCGSWANASGTFLKQEVVVVVSVLDQMAFSDADTRSFKRYIKQILPHHELIHIVANASLRLPSEKTKIQIREKLMLQIKNKIKSNHIITHLVIMDHGSTEISKEGNFSHLRYLGSFNETAVQKNFQEIFNPLVGRFSPGAFVMLEACSTVCDSDSESQKRIHTLMKYFKIPNGRVFAAYQDMVSVGYDLKFHLEQVGYRLKHPALLVSGLVIGFASQFGKLSNFNFAEMVALAIGSNVALSVGLKLYGFIKTFSEKVNWGYLYQFQDGFIRRVQNLNPYTQMNKLYDEKHRAQTKVTSVSCKMLFH